MLIKKVWVYARLTIVNTLCNIHKLFYTTLIIYSVWTLKYQMTYLPTSKESCVKTFFASFYKFSLTYAIICVTLWGFCGATRPYNLFAHMFPFNNSIYLYAHPSTFHVNLSTLNRHEDASMKWMHHKKINF